MAQTLEVPNISLKKVKILQKAAKRKGISTEQYLKAVVEDHLVTLERVSTAESAKPLRETWGNLTDVEIDELVEKKRGPHHSKKRNGHGPVGLPARPTIRELSRPFQEAFKGVSEEELDRIVDAARTRHYETQQLRKRRR